MQALSLWLIINPAPPVVSHTYLCLQLYGMTITPSTWAEAEEEGIKGNLEKEEPRAPVIFVQSTWNRGSETQINTVRVNAGDSVWAMPFLYCQLSGHAACRSHHWLPLIITIMNVEAWIHKCYCKNSLQADWKEQHDCCLLYIHIRRVRFWYLAHNGYYSIILPSFYLRISERGELMMTENSERTEFILCTHEFPKLVYLFKCWDIASRLHRTFLQLPCQCFSKCK